MAMAAQERNFHWLMSWRSILAGFFIADLAYAILSMLGLGVGGLSLAGVIQNGHFQGFGVGTAVWIVAAQAIAVFVGSYFASRMSNLETRRIGSAQGLVVASLFFLFMAFEAMTVLGIATSGVSLTADAVGNMTNGISSNIDFNDAVHTALGDKTLKSSPDVVARELATRLAAGNTNSAKTYLAEQTGQSPAEVDQQIQQLQNQVQAKAKEAGVTASRIIAGVGWMSFITLILGSLAALWGGSLGSRANDHSPLSKREASTETKIRTA